MMGDAHTGKGYLTIHRQCVLCGQMFRPKQQNSTVCWRENCQREHKKALMAHVREEARTGGIHTGAPPKDPDTLHPNHVGLYVTDTMYLGLKATARRRNVRVSNLVRGFIEKGMENAGAD